MNHSKKQHGVLRAGLKYSFKARFVVSVIYSVRTLSLFTILFALSSSYLLLSPSQQPAQAQTPNTTLNFQARILTVGGALVPDGNYNLEFKIYDSTAAGGTAQGVCSLNSSTDDCWWLETRTGANVVRVVNGYVSVNLGSVTAFGASIPWSQDLYVTMRVGGTGAPSWDTTEMTNATTGRMKISAVPIAFTANQLSKISGANTTVLGITTPTATQTYNLPNQIAGTYNICTDGNNCNALTGYLKRNAVDTSAFAVTATNYQYTFTNSSSAVASGELKVDNGNNTGIGILSTATAGTLLDLQNGGTSIFGVTAAKVATFSGANTGQLSVASSLAGGARATDLVAITQANDATNSSTTPLLSVTNSDLSSTGALVSFVQSATTGASTYALSLSSSNSNAPALRVASSAAGTDIGFNGRTTGTYLSASVNTLTTGTGISLGGSGTQNTNFTGSAILINPSRTNSTSQTDTGNLLNISRTGIINGAGQTYTISGDVAALSSTCTQTAGTCTDTSSVLSLNQQYVNASGAVLNVLNSGTGNLATLDGSNATGNGVSIDVQSSSSAQFGLKVTSNNGATTGLYVGADGRTGVGTATTTGNTLTVSNGATTDNILVAQDNGTAVFTVGDNGTVLVKNSVDTGGALTVQKAGSVVNVLNVDTTNQITTLRGTATDAVISGTNLAAATTCSGTNWAGVGPWTHTTGSVVALTCTVPASVTNGATYQVTYTVASNTTATNTVAATLGGVVSPAQGANAVHTVIITTTATTGITFTPTTNFNGTINTIVINLVTPANSVLTLQNNAGATALEVRASGTTTNTFVGLSSGASNTTGASNAGFGSSALLSNTTGSFNTALGATALQNNTTGTQNTAFGFGTLKNNTTGSTNIALGYTTLQNNTTGTGNIAIGSTALLANTTANDSIAIGNQALTASVSGAGNVAIGVASLQSSVTAADNTGVGYNTLSASTGGRNAAFGSSAGGYNTSGINNTYLGANAGFGDGSFFTQNGISNSGAIGWQSVVQASNSLTIGGQGTNAVNVGIGTTIPTNTLSVSPIQYNTGTASITTGTGTVTGTATFTANMVGGEIIIDGGSQSVAPYKGTVTGFTNATTITVSPNAAATFTTKPYRIHYVGLQVKSDGTVGIGVTPSTAQLEVKVQAGGSTKGLIINNNTSTGNIFEAQDNAIPVVTIADGGASTFKNFVNSTTAFQIQDSAGANLLTMDTTNQILFLASQVESIDQFNNSNGGIGQTQNLLTFSEQFDNAAWTKTNATATANSIAGPDNYTGFATPTAADTLATTVAGGSVKQAFTTATIGNYTFSVWLKTASGTQNVDLRIDSTGTNAQTGTVKTVTANTVWQRYFVTQNITGPTISTIVANIFPGGTGGSSAVTEYGYGAQLNQTTTMLVYTRTTTTTQAQNQGVISNGGIVSIALDANDTPLLVQGAPAQTADLLKVQNSAGTDLFKVSSTGLVNSAVGFVVNGTSGASTTCSGGQIMQNQVVSGGITTGGSCSAAGTGTVTGSGVAGQVPYWSTSSALAGNTNFTWDNTNSRLGLGTAGLKVSAWGGLGVTYSAASVVIGSNIYVNPADTVSRQVRSINTHATYGHSYVEFYNGDFVVNASRAASTADAIVTPVERLRIDGSTGNVTSTSNFDFNGGQIRSDFAGGTYDVWLQGVGAFGSSGDGRNLALLGVESTDDLILNYNTEYDCVSIGGTACTQALEVTGTILGTGNLTLTPANPSITSGSSYIVIPNGLYVSGGTFYAQNQLQARGGVNNDSGNLTLSASGGNILTSNQVQAPIYYDINNTGYYSDPNATSRLGTIIADDILSTGNWQVRSNNDGATGIYWVASGQERWYASGLDTVSVVSNNSVNIGGGVAPGATGSASLFVAGKASSCVIGNGAAATNCSSDSRLKNTIQSTSGNLAKLGQLRSVSYKWNSQGATAPTHIGLIAQEVAPYYPEMVTQDANGYYQLDYAAFVSPLIGAVQELKVITDTLSARLSVLESGEFSGDIHVRGEVVVDEALTVNGDTEVQQLTVNGKIITAGATPTIVLGAQATGQGAVTAILGNDTAGNISYVAGTQVLPLNPLVSGAQASVTFTTPYAQAPRIALTAKDAGSAEVRYYVETTTTGFVIHFIDTPVAGSTYTFDYIVIQ